MAAVDRAEASLRDLILGGDLPVRGPARRGRAGGDAGHEPHPGARGPAPAGVAGTRRGHRAQGRARRGLGSRPDSTRSSCCAASSRAWPPRPRRARRPTTTSRTWRRWPAELKDYAFPASTRRLDKVTELNGIFHQSLLRISGSSTLTTVVSGLIHSSVLHRTQQAQDEHAMLPQRQPPPRDRRRGARRATRSGPRASCAATCCPARASLLRTPPHASDHGLDAPGGTMSYRLGVDVGGTFTDVLLDRRGDRADLAGQDRRPPRTTSASACCAASRRSAPSPGSTRADRRGAARHDGRDQRDPRGQGRQGRPRHHAGLPPDPADRAVVRPRRPGRLDHLAQARAAGRPAAHRRGRSSASPPTARGHASSTRTTSAPKLRRLKRRRHRVAVRLPHQLLRQRRPREPHRRARRGGAARRPGLAVLRRCCPSCASTSAPITTVANGYVQPQVASYVSQPRRRSCASQRRGRPSCRSCAATAVWPAREVAADNPVSLLLSGPAGGVTGAAWAAEKAGFRDFLTFDMGGTSTDVALVQDLKPRIGRETTVGDLKVRATSVDVRTVGAGGGSIAHVPQLTQALRVGPQSAGAVPGPAAYGGGGTRADRHRRQRRARLPADASWPAVRSRSTSRPPRDGGADHRRRDRARSVEAAAAGHRRHRQREHVRRAAPGLGAAGLRPPRLRARRLRRRRPAARQRARQADRRLAGHHPAVARRA